MQKVFLSSEESQVSFTNYFYSQALCCTLFNIGNIFFIY